MPVQASLQKQNSPPGRERSKCHFRVFRRHVPSFCRKRRTRQSIQRSVCSLCVCQAVELRGAPCGDLLHSHLHPDKQMHRQG